MNPEITVLMSVYNGEKYIRDSVESILGQTFRDFEFLVIDDGSTDNSSAIIDSYHDKRIRILHNQNNIGLTKSLNVGLELAKGNYIVRMDADDISLPERFAKQHSFMNKNHDVGICGTWLQTIGDKKTFWKPPLNDDSIRAALIFENVLYHPTVIFRRLLFKEKNLYYDESLICAQDYDLWSRCTDCMNFANIDEVLLKRRIHSDAIGAIHKTKQRDVSSRVHQFYLSKIGITPTEKEVNFHKDLSSWRINCDRKFVLDAERWLLKLQGANRRTVYIPEQIFMQVLAERWYKVCRMAQGLGLWTWKTFHNSTLSEYITLQPINSIGFGVKCLMHI